MPRILVTNDDGVQSEGIQALGAAMRSLGDVWVVAPTGEASATGHALTLRRPLRIERISERWFSVDGTPTDCVNIAVSRILDGEPDVIVSGINKGWNLGDDVTYSGTVAGAMEGALLGIRSLAVSQQWVSGEYDFLQATRAAERLVQAMLVDGLPARTFLNVNVPRHKARGIRVTVQARRNHEAAVVEARDPRQQPYYWIEEGQLDWEPHERSDYQTVRDGWISVTPLKPDWTDHDAIASVEALALGAYAEIE
jgi:5'-nucleotidase